MANGKAKSTTVLYQTETIPQMCDNINKEIKLDTGGTRGCIPDSIKNFIAEIRSAATIEEAAQLLMRRENKRATALRRAVMKRTIGIKCKVNGASLYEYLELLDDKQRVTSSDCRKKPIRRILCRQSN